MGKRYKSGNIGKSKNRQGKIYIQRERRINKLINEFRDLLFHKDQSRIDIYKQSDKLRMDIKYLLAIQSKPFSSLT